MSEFKGTKGKLSIVSEPYKYKGEYQGIFKIENENGVFFGSTDAYDFRGYTFRQAKANALLISKAPEMLEMLKKISLCLTSFNPPTKEIALNWASEINQLINEATEL